MGGNINDSRPPPPGVAGGTLLGPEGTAAGREAEAGSSGSGFGPETHIADCVGLVGLRVGSGFGGVFVNWIVDASI